MIPLEDLTTLAVARIGELEDFLTEAFPSKDREQQEYKEKKFARLVTKLIEERRGR
jgi:hypothetical protein